MSNAITGSFLISFFLLITMAMFSGLLGTTAEQTDALRETSQIRGERLRTLVSITSTARCKVYTATVQNESSQVSFGDYSKMDVLARYTDSTGDIVSQHLDYPADWTISSITPNNGGTSTWDPGETATFSITLVPDPKPNTKGTVLVAVPGGIHDSAYFDGSPQRTCFYLHNNPTPPDGDTGSQPVLPMSATPPTAAKLFNYDNDRDSASGVQILKGGNGANESNPLKYQAWRSGALAGGMIISGDATIDFWAGIKDFQGGIKGKVTFFLRDYDGAGYTEIANGLIDQSDWQAGSDTFVKKTVTMPGLSYAMAAGHILEAKVVVNPPSADDTWFAYDTLSYPAVVGVLP